MTAAIYARVSKERCPRDSCGHLYTEHPRNGRCKHASCKCARYEGQDPENQLVELRRYAKAHAWETVEYIDHETGKHSDRDSLKALFEDGSRRKFEVVLVWALDRLSREGIFATFEHLKKLKGYGVQFESYSEPQFRTTGPGGEIFAELMIALAAWMAKQEHQRISERTKAGLARARREGRVGGRRPKIFDRERARKLREQIPPMSWRAIGKLLNVPQSSIRDALERVRETSRKKARKGVTNTRPTQG